MKLPSFYVIRLWIHYCFHNTSTVNRISTVLNLVHSLLILFEIHLFPSFYSLRISFMKQLLLTFLNSLIRATYTSYPH